MIKVNKKLIESFIESTNWNEVWNPKRAFSEDDTSSVTEFVDFEEFDINSGVTKLVLIPKTIDNFVIKLPFLYFTNFDYDTHEEYYTEFTQAPFSSFDYCNSELQYFILAQQQGVGMFFPETIQYCEFPYPIYLQEKCLTLCQNPSTNNISIQTIHKIFKSHNIADEIINKTNSFSSRWLYDCILQYTLDTTVKMLQFLLRYGITDFHFDNYGYRIKDKTPVLIDFSSFNES